jgi:hypothetical protein
MAYATSGKRERDRARQQAAVNKKAKVKAALLKVAEPKAVEPVEIPKIIIKEVAALYTHTNGNLKWFEVSLRFSDDRRRRWDLHMGDLKNMGTDITRLTETKKLKDWVFSEAGRAYFEGQVNAK